MNLVSSTLNTLHALDLFHIWQLRYQVWHLKMIMLQSTSHWRRTLFVKPCWRVESLCSLGLLAALGSAAVSTSAGRAAYSFSNAELFLKNHSWEVKVCEGESTLFHRVLEHLPWVWVTQKSDSHLFSWFLELRAIWAAWRSHRST